MATTRIFVTQDAAVAAQTAGFWTELGGHTVLPIGPTSPIAVTKAEDDSSLWTSGAAGDWYCIVVTQNAANQGVAAGGAADGEVQQQSSGGQ